MRKLKNVLVTGGAGFIGSNFIHYLFGKSTSGEKAFEDANFSGRIINVDCLTYAGNGETLEDIDKTFGSGEKDPSKRRYFFEKVNICDRSEIERIFKQYDIDTVVHFAAESHVDRSILGPETFIKTNIFGTYTLLDVARNYWGVSLDNPRDDVLFHHISTDEVYGSLGPTGYFTETTAYDPRSPYSSSKASSDHLVMAYYHTYDWIYVEDHNRAVWLILNNGKTGEKYNIGGENEWQNITLLDKLIELTAKETGMSESDIKSTITHVKDRPGHDQRYAIDCTKIKTELGWERKMSFEQGLLLTVKWNLNNKDWINHILSGEYLNWVEKNYSKR